MEAQVRIDPGAQDGDVDRLGDEIIRAGAQALDLMVGVGVAGEHDDGRLRDLGVGRGADQLADLRAVEIGHLVIEHDQRRAVAFEQLQGLEAALALDDLVILLERADRAAGGSADRHRRSESAAGSWSVEWVGMSSGRGFAVADSDARRYAMPRGRSGIFRALQRPSASSTARAGIAFAAAWCTRTLFRVSNVAFRISSTRLPVHGKRRLPLAHAPAVLREPGHADGDDAVGAAARGEGVSRHDLDHRGLPGRAGEFQSDAGAAAPDQGIDRREDHAISGWNGRASRRRSSTRRRNWRSSRIFSKSTGTTWSSRTRATGSCCTSAG